jgi:hypothetical protein
VAIVLGQTPGEMSLVMLNNENRKSQPDPLRETARVVTRVRIDNHGLRTCIQKLTQITQTVTEVPLRLGAFQVAQVLAGESHPLPGYQAERALEIASHGQERL